MKKLILLFLTLLVGISASWAETYTITFDKSTGSFYNGSNAVVTSGWVAKWVSNEAGKPAVTLTASANNINAENGRMAPGTSGSCTYSLSVEAGCTITGFELNCPTSGAQVTVTPNGEAAVIAATGEKIVVNSSATSFVYSGSNSGRILAASTGDGGSFKIFVEGPAEKFTAYNTAKGWINSIQSANGLVKDAAKYTSNAKSTAEGSYEALLDGDYATYFHTAYGNAGPDADHYLQAELTEAVDAIHFYYKKRSQNNNNRPTSITISGSNDGTTFTDITTISSGLPTNAAVIDYASDKVSLGASYKYLRFTVTATNNGAASNGHVFFTFSEFYIMPANDDIDAAITMLKNLPASAGELTDAQVTEINTINTALTSTTVNVTYELYESDGTTLVSSEIVVQNKNSAVAIPSSLTTNPYYDYATEGTIGTDDCTIKVTRTLKSSVVYPITNLSNNKAYTLTTKRGALGTDGTQMVSTYGTSHTKGNFAIISYEGNYYLYSVADSKFVGNPTTINTIVNQPQLTDDLSQVTPVSFTLTTVPYYFVGMGSNGVNCSTYATGIVVNNWTTHDDGNQYVIEEAAAFDPTAALAALDEYFHPSYTVTYKVQDEGGNILFTSDPVGTTLGANITTLPAEYQLTDFYSYNTIDVTVSGTSTIALFTATLKATPIFKFTADTTAPVWHKLKMKDANYPTYVADGTPNVTLPTTDANDETVQWAFIGEPYAGFKIINRAAGTGLVLGSASASDGANGANTFVTLAAPGTQTYEKFFAYHSGHLTNGFFLFNDEGYAMNLRGDKLAYWTGGYDKGSTFVATEILEGEALFNELVAQLEAINFGTGLGQYSLVVESTDYTSQAAAIISGLKEQGYTAENLTNAQLMLAGTTINLPKANTFFRIRSSQGVHACLKSANESTRMTFTTTEDKETIFLYSTDNKIISYSKGLAVNNVREMGSVGGAASIFSVVAAVSGNVGQYSLAATYSGNTNYLHSTGVDGSNADRNTLADQFKQNNSFTLETVSSLPVTITAAGYATLYAPVALTIPTGVTAYVAADNGEYLSLTAIEGGIIPAETGVILAGNEGTYDFAITTGGSVEGNALTGTIEAIARPENSYILSKNSSNVVAFYKDGATTIPGFKAYLASGVGDVKEFRFDNETGIRSIDNEKMRNGENEMIFNLAGQRVAKAQKGLYIVNGKKLLVK